MRRRRPPGLTTMGVLNIVFGSLFLLCSLCNGGQLMMNTAAANRGPRGFLREPGAEMLEALKAEIPGYMAIEVSRHLLHLGLAILLLTAGIGLLNMQRWARVGSIIYAVATIILEIGSLIFQLAFVNPVTSRVLGQIFGPFGDLGFFPDFINTMTIASAFLLLIYAVVLLIMMLVPGTRAALEGHAAGDGYRGDGYDDEGYEHERRPRRRDDWEY